MLLVNPPCGIMRYPIAVISALWNIVFASGLNTDDTAEKLGACFPDWSISTDHEDWSLSEIETVCVSKGSNVKVHGTLVPVSEVLLTTWTTCKNHSTFITVQTQGKLVAVYMYLVCFLAVLLFALTVAMVILLLKIKGRGDGRVSKAKEHPTITYVFEADETDMTEGNQESANLENDSEVVKRRRPEPTPNQSSSFRINTIRAKTDTLGRMNATQMMDNPICVPPEKSYRANYVSSNKLKRQGCVVGEEGIYENIKRPGKCLKPFSAEMNYVGIDK
ncbi:uncharacterized protein LOC121420774 [Lytechinus variegatus]|uniref:uncharacterized protein LOC121420774 n=1 Tax=Lytechinus variegatus TaxID=7654 RepID=UPI001BB232D5|nr:uncharacterized protein LOC121420774 [Lytechinus variegatus]